MKKRYPHAAIVLAAAMLITTGVSAVSAYAVTEPPAETASESTAEDGENSLWKAEISDYDSSLSLVQYEQVEPSEAEIEAMADATAPKASAFLGSSGVSGSANIGAGYSAVGYVEAGQFAFTTYGYGHCVGMSQNGANAYATYGGYDYQSILFHYYPGTSLVQTDASGTITAAGVTGSVLDIISQIVYNEMSSSMHPEAMKAQAVAAYTYIMYNGGSCNSVKLKPDPPQNVIDAVSSVLGQALYYNGDYALTVYGASSGGATASSGDIWGTQYDYLVSVPCEYDADYDNYYGKVTYMSTEEVRTRISSAFGVALSSSPSNWIQINYGDSGYARSVTIDGQKTVNGMTFANALGLLSPRFAFICN